MPNWYLNSLSALVRYCYFKQTFYYFFCFRMFSLPFFWLVSVTSLLRSHVFSCECDEYEVKIKQLDHLGSSDIPDIALQCEYNCSEILSVAWRLKTNGTFKTVYTDHDNGSLSGAQLGYEDSIFGINFSNNIHFLIIVNTSLHINGSIWEYEAN